MVYDEHGNYIGDHHWRTAGEVQDGDELELDKGVLIEVGERMGTTQQDLTNLFEKRKSSQTSPSSNRMSSQQLQHSHSQSSQKQTTSMPTATPSFTPTPASSRPSGSQSFRSLNDLLGIKRTPAEYRPSPYEERHPQVTSRPEPSEPAPKRPKVSVGTIPTRSKNVQSGVVDLTESEPETEPQQTRTPSHPTPREKARSNVPIVIPTEESQRKPKGAPSIPNSTSQPRLIQPQEDSPIFAKPALPPPSETRPVGNIPVPPRAPPQDAQNTHTKNKSTHITPDNNDSLRNSRISRPQPDTEPPQQPIKTLRMATDRPRRKLMYSALLPSDTSQKSSPPVMGPPEKRSQSTPKPKESPHASAQDPASTNMEFLPSVSTQFILEEMVVNPGIDSGQNNVSHAGSKESLPSPAQNLSAKRSLDAPLRKSLSDPSALTARSGLHRPTVMRSALSTAPESAEEIEQGPWTSDALDLFDFWPPGRPKPVQY